MALMRRYINWVSMHNEHGSGSWAVIDDTLTVRTANGTKSEQLNGRKPAAIARVLMHELSIERPEDAA
jgi:hypothetical protein